MRTASSRSCCSEEGHVSCKQEGLVAAIPNKPARMGATVRVAALVFGKIAGLPTINMVLTEPARL